jgi:23S rRNA (cytosine1962-C5)-methyltransferase
MRTAADWKDYELIDCSGGERLERWGTAILLRPDPQVIWDTPREHPGWQNYDARYVRSGSGGGHWAKRGVPNRWQITWRELKFHVGPMNFKHVGLFPEQAVNWDYTAGLVRDHADRRQAAAPATVLNLFAYTGGATLALAQAGAHVCHVDAAKGMVAWAKENAALSGLADRPIRWIVDDCAKFVEREIRRGVTYDAIVMDPPSYGRGPGGEIWKLEDSLFAFVEMAAKLLSADPCFFLINSYTTGLSPAVMSYVLAAILRKDRGGTVSCDELGLPVTQGGLILPCGATAIWRP